MDTALWWFSDPYRIAISIGVLACFYMIRRDGIQSTAAYWNGPGFDLSCPYSTYAWLHRAPNHARQSLIGVCFGLFTAMFASVLTCGLVLGPFVCLVFLAFGWDGRVDWAIKLN